jgi:prevent-host-death family protein
MEIGVRELKQQLSRYLERVAAGEEITVTDRGRPKARLVPVVEHGVFEQGVEAGWIGPALADRTIGEARRHPSARRTTEVLDDDRGR